MGVTPDILKNKDVKGWRAGGTEWGMIYSACQNSLIFFFSFFFSDPNEPWTLLSLKLEKGRGQCETKAERICLSGCGG